MPGSLNNKNCHPNYRLGVGIMVVNQMKKIFVGKRNDVTNIQKYNIQSAWQMPQGGIDEGEDPKTAALRELLEEIGTNQVELIAESKDWFYYDIPDDLQGKYLHAKYNGQKQKWYLALLVGPENLININTTNPEFTDWKWAEIGEVVDLIVDFKKSMYQKIVKEFEWYFEK